MPACWRFNSTLASAIPILPEERGKDGKVGKAGDLGRGTCLASTDQAHRPYQPYCPYPASRSLDRDAVRVQLSIEIRALHAEGVGGAGDVAGEVAKPRQ